MEEHKNVRFDLAHPTVLRLLIPLLLLSLFWNLGLSPAYLEEPRRAIVAMEMLFRDNFIVPTQLGEIYVNKPPLFNWVLMIGYRALGNYPEALPRIISVLSLLGMGALVFRIARRETDAATAWAWALFTVCSADIYFYFSTTGEIDLFYSFISLASILAVYRYEREGKTIALYTVPWVLAALGFLTKGFPSPLFAGLTYLGWLGFRGRFRALFHPAHALGLALFGLITGAYFYLYHQQADLGFYLGGLFDQSSQRTAAEHNEGDLLQHLLLFFPDTLKNILPASLLLPIVFSSYTRKKLWAQPLLRFAVLALLANIWVYWLSPGTRPRYVYMLYPLAILPFVLAYRPDLRQINRWLKGLNVFLALVFPLGLILLPFFWQQTDTINSLRLVCWIGAPLAGVLLYYAVRRFNNLAVLLLLTVLGRMAFNGIVLPLRAVQGEAPQWKSQGLEIAAFTGDAPLHLLGIRDAGSFPLATAYYIEREREQVLDCDTVCRAGSWVIAEPGQMEGSGRVPEYAFTWKAYSFGLYPPVESSP